MIRYGQFGLFLSSLFKIFVFLNDSEKNPLRTAPYCALPRALRSTFENMRAQYGVRLSEVCRVSAAAIFTFSIFQGYFAHDISTFQMSYKVVSSDQFEVQVQPKPYLEPRLPTRLLCGTGGLTRSLNPTCASTRTHTHWRSTAASTRRTSAPRYPETTLRREADANAFSLFSLLALYCSRSPRTRPRST